MKTELCHTCGTNEDGDMKKDKIKVYVYTRVSTAVQVDGYSLDAQKSRMKAYAEFNLSDFDHLQRDSIHEFLTFCYWNKIRFVILRHYHI